MKSRQRRLKAIELSLTPQQTVLLWLTNAVKCRFQDGALQFPRARIANSILKTITHSMKGESDAMVERAVLQGRQEADVLYNLVITVNDRVLTSTSERIREFVLLRQYVRGTTYINVGTHSEEELRRTVLFFVEEVLLLDGAISQVCAERFGSQSILFLDSALKLKEQLDLADMALGYFNLLARQLNFKELTAESVRETLGSEMVQQVSKWGSLARIQMLSDFGDETDCRAACSQFLREFSAPRTDEGRERYKRFWLFLRQTSRPEVPCPSRMPLRKPRTESRTGLHIHRH